jgi:transcriptional regulator with XRE-family HTH domain
METQGQKIRRVRDERGIKQKFISEATGLTQAHLSRIENDLSGVTRNTLRKIAEALGVSFESLYVPKSAGLAGSEGTVSANIDEVLEDDAAMIRFMGGERPDDATMQWVRRSLSVIREEIRRRKM